MSTTLMIILGLLGITVAGYFFAQLANAFNHLEHPAYRNPQHPRGYAPNTMAYPPRPPAEESQGAGVPFWPVMVLMVIAATFYLASTPAPAGKPGRASAPGTSSVTSTYDSGQFDNVSSGGTEHKDTKEEVRSYPVPLSTPSTRKPAQAEKPGAAFPTSYGTERNAVDRPYQAPDYRTGYGVQLFAKEKGWWEDAHVRSIQQNYKGHQLLIGTGYTPGRASITKFILGPFDTREEAARFARRIQKDFPGAFPADLSKLERVERYWPYP